MPQGVNIAKSYAILLAELLEPKVRSVVVHRASVPLDEQAVKILPLVTQTSALCVLLLSQLPQHMLVDSKFFTKSQFHGELYDIYKNATVRFTYSDEIYASDFENYLSNKITLDEFITEADRKLSAYMNE